MLKIIKNYERNILQPVYEVHPTEVDMLKIRRINKLNIGGEFILCDSPKSDELTSYCSDNNLEINDVYKSSKNEDSCIVMTEDSYEISVTEA